MAACCTPGLAGDIVFALPVELDEIALDQRELARLDLDKEDVAARRQDDEVDLPVPVLARCAVCQATLWKTS